MATGSQPQTPTSPWHITRLSIDSSSSELSSVSPLRQRTLAGNFDRSGSNIRAQDRRPSCNISIDRIRAGSIFSTPESPADAEYLNNQSEVSRRSSLTSIHVESPDTTVETSSTDHTQKLSGARQFLARTRIPFIVGIVSYLALWVLDSTVATGISGLLYHACSISTIPIMTVYLPIDLCGIPRIGDSTFNKLLDTQTKYEKIFKYVNKRTSVFDKLTETAKRADMEMLLDERNGGQNDLFGHSADFSNALLDLGSFFKQVRESAERFVIADKVTKASLKAMTLGNSRWSVLQSERRQLWKAVNIHDTLVESSLAQVGRVIQSSDTAARRFEVVESFIHGVDRSSSSTGASPSPIREISDHIKEVHALLGLVRDGAEKIRDDLRRLQRTGFTSTRSQSSLDGKQTSLESSAARWVVQLEARIFSFENILQGTGIATAVASSKTFGTIDPLLIMTSTLSPDAPFAVAGR
ncbi:hypothetical protein TruAng_002945 [Truncatella angustata]|nr:hypothetical protein TruAng_002945 [Truncatella angustata]